MDYNQCKPLFDAVWSGDWNKAKEFLTLNPNAIRATIPSTKKTALHMAIESEHEHIVEELVQLMSEEDLELQNIWGSTALAVAAEKGSLKMVECQVRKSKKILSIPTASNWTPIIFASITEHWDVVNYLYSVTPLEDLMPEKGPHGATLLENFIMGMKFGKSFNLIKMKLITPFFPLIIQNLFFSTTGIALKLIKDCPRLVFTQGLYGFPMEGFMPAAFPSGTRLKFWQRWIYNC